VLDIISGPIHFTENVLLLSKAENLHNLSLLVQKDVFADLVKKWQKPPKMPNFGQNFIFLS